MTTELVGASAVTGPGTAPAPKATSEAAGLELLRRERVQEHLRVSLDKTDALEANLGAVSADLMRLAYRLNAAIEESLEQKTLEGLEKLLPAIDAYLRVTRQIDRLAGLDRRLAAAPRARVPSKPR